MHKQNNQHLYFFTPTQNPTIPIHTPQQHPNHHYIHRIEPIPTHSSTHRNQYISEPKLNYCGGNQNDFMIFRKDQRGSGFNNDGQTSRQIYTQYSNTQIQQAANRTSVYNLENIRNQPMIQIKRKQSVNLTSREVRDQYYKGHQMEELMNKLPQIDLQPLNRVHAPRQTHVSPPIQLRTTREMKKAVSPFHIQNRSLSFKENNFQGGLLRKLQTQENNENKHQNKRPKEFIRFNSPVRTPASSNFQSPQKQCLNPERFQTQSGCSTRRQSNADTSNSCSTMFQPETKIFQGIPSPRLNCINKSANELPECTVMRSQQYVRTQIDQSQEYEENNLGKSQERSIKLKDVLEKSNHLQNEAKMKNMELQLNKVKEQSQKTIVELKVQYDLKRDSQTKAIKQEYQKKMTAILDEMKSLKQKWAQQHKEDEQKLANEQNIRKQLQKTLSALADQKNLLIQEITTKQNKLKSIIQLNKQLQASNLAMRDKNESLNKQIQSLKVTVCELTTKLHEQNTNIRMPNVELAEHNKNLEQKLSSFLVNMDKQVVKYKECKSELEKSYRRIEELNMALFDKDNNIKNMLKQLRARDKFISELKKNVDVTSKLVKASGEDIMKLQLRASNEKYRHLADEAETENIENYPVQSI